MATAPAPSPNNIQVFRSPQSTHLLIASAPTTKAELYVPVSRNCEAVTNANKNPEHAAVTSKATAFLQPHWSATFAASPNKSSGVEVATITRPTSAGSNPERSRAFCAADAAWSAMDSPGCSTLLDLMPVRCEIHSSLVSTNSEISSWTGPSRAAAQDRGVERGVLEGARWCF